MVGNVWEWTSDYYLSDYYTTETTTNPTGPNTGTEMVVHGGGWDDEFNSIRSSNRYGTIPEEKKIDTGFRCAKSVE